MPAMYVDLDEWLKVTSSWRMRSRSPSPHNILIRPASSSHIVPNRSITAGQKSEDTPAANTAHTMSYYPPSQGPANRWASGGGPGRHVSASVGQSTVKHPRHVK